VLDDVFGPESLGAVVDFDGFEGLGVRMSCGVACGEGDVLGGVPILGEDDVIEFFGEGVNEGDDGVAVGDG